jgi:hypothetical protein
MLRQCTCIVFILQCWSVNERLLDDDKSIWNNFVPRWVYYMFYLLLTNIKTNIGQAILVGKWCYARRSLAFSPVFKPHTHITYMLRQCTSVVYFPYSNANDMRVTQDLNSFGHIIAHAHILRFVLKICFFSERLILCSWF